MGIVMRMLSHGSWAKQKNESKRGNCCYRLERAIDISMHVLPPDARVAVTLGAHLRAISARLKVYVTSNGGLVPHNHRYLERNFIRNSAVARIGRRRSFSPPSELPVAAL